MFTHKYDNLITIENLLATWNIFLAGKRHKKDVMLFQTQLSDNIVALYHDLVCRTYTHGPYIEFNVSDPKPRVIHKATVRDRIVHHLIYKELYWYFDTRFIFDSYSCRKNKGTHKAWQRFENFAQKVSLQNSRQCFVLKCDIRKFFANINHTILRKILARHIEDEEIISLIECVMNSFNAGKIGVGLPLGNLTSQLLVNVYMHEFDMFMKQELRVRYYVRYADDFLIVHHNKKYLENILIKIEKFLSEHLKLELHPDKVFIKTYSSGVDFLGWTHFPYHRQIRKTTKRKIVRNMKYYPKSQSVSSYRGLLQHGHTYRLQKRLGINIF